MPPWLVLALHIHGIEDRYRLQVGLAGPQPPAPVVEKVGDSAAGCTLPRTIPPVYLVANKSADCTKQSGPHISNLVRAAHTDHSATGGTHCIHESISEVLLLAIWEPGWSLLTI